MHSALASLVAFALAAPHATPGPETDWPHLRGPSFDGHAVSSVFEGGDFGLKVAWRAPLGPGYSAVAVSRGTAVTMCSDGASDVVVAFNARSGAERWRRALGPTYRGHDGSEDGPISTPLVHRGMVYVLDPRGRLTALELERGDEVWSLDLVARHGARAPEYGCATTPCAEGDLVFVQLGGDGGRALAALDARSGELRWSFGDEAVDYQSPALMTLAGRRMLVAFRGPGTLAAHDPQSGALLWEHALGENDSDGSAIPSPIDEHRFVAVLGRGLVAFEVRPEGEGFRVSEAFRCRDLGNTYAPPVRCGDHLYGLRGEFLTCVDARSGERVWKSRPPGGRGLILVGDRLVIYGAEGRVVVARATPEGYREEANLQALESSALTWPSFADGRIYLRNPHEMVAVEVTERGGSVPVAAAAAAAPAPAPGDGAFARFLRELDAADDKAERLDAFMRAQDRFPLVEGDQVHFVYRGPARDVAVAGTMIAARQAEPLQRVAGTDFHHRSYRVAAGSRVEYQFQIDMERWEPDALNPRQVPSPWGPQRSEVLMPGYVEPRHIAEPPAEGRGRLETFTLSGPGLEPPRQIRVYVPHGTGTQPLPLLVVQQGPSWIEKGLLVNTLDNLIGREIAPVLVAFVDTIDAWWLEAGGSRTAEFVQMLAERLVPELERRYPLRSTPAARAILGTEDYALTAVYAALVRPDVFGKAAAQSAALRNGAQDALFERLGAAAGRSNLEFYVDWNLYELRSADHGFDFGKDSRTLAEALRSAGYPCAGGEMADAHGWSGWRARSDRILKAFFPKPAA